MVRGSTMLLEGPVERLDGIEDQWRGIVTYRLPNGDHIQFDARSVAEYGVVALLEREGYQVRMPTQRIPVHQSGRLIGTLPPDFDPDRVRSTNWLYDPRPGDFRYEKGVIVANRMLGPGDLEAVPGFRRE